MSIRKKDLFYIALFVLVFNVKNSIFYTENYIPLYIMIGFTVFIILAISKKLKISKKIVQIFRRYFGPYLLVSCFSMMTAAFVYKESIKPYITQTFVYLVLHFSAFISALYIYLRNRKRTFKIAIVAAGFSYATLVVKWIYVAGFPECLDFMNKSVSGVTLEVNYITYASGMLFVYALLSNEITNRKKLHWCMVLFILIFLGNKRAIYLALFAAIMIYYLFFCVFKHSNRALKIVAFSFIGVALLWVYVIKSGLLEAVVTFFGINTMSRLQLWNYVGNAYEFSPLYLGRGLVYSDMQTISSAYIRTYGITGGSSQIHNDILRMYIGWGFIPFIYYWYCMIYKNIKLLAKGAGSEIAWRGLAVLVYTFFIYFFDNMFTAYNVSIILFLILLDFELEKNDMRI